MRPSIKQLLYEAKERFFKALESKLNTPIRCPLCENNATIWKKTIIRSAARELCHLVRDYDGKPIHLDEISLSPTNRGNGNFSQLALWGLIVMEPKRPEDTTRRTSGMWRPARKGVQFVLGREKLPKYVITYNNEVLEFCGEEVSITEVVGDDFEFNFQELMSRKTPFLD